MDNAQIESLLKNSLELAEVQVRSEGTHFHITAVGDCFDGLSRVKQQQAVYAPLKDNIADGSIHAVTIKAYTPAQWQREKHFN